MQQIPFSNHTPLLISTNTFKRHYSPTLNGFTQCTDSASLFSASTKWTMNMVWTPLPHVWLTFTLVISHSVIPSKFLLLLALLPVFCLKADPSFTGHLQSHLVPTHTLWTPPPFRAVLNHVRPLPVPACTQFLLPLNLGSLVILTIFTVSTAPSTGRVDALFTSTEHYHEWGSASILRLWCYSPLVFSTKRVCINGNLNAGHP